MKIGVLIHESFANSYAMYWVEPSTGTVHTGFDNHGRFAMDTLGYGDEEIEYLLSKAEDGYWDNEEEEQEWKDWFEQWKAAEMAEGRSGNSDSYRDECILAALADGWVRAEYEGGGVLDLEANSVQLAQAAAKLILHEDTSAINLSINGERGFSVTIPAHRIPHFIKGRKVMVESAIVVDRQLEPINEALTPERIEQLKQTPGVFWHGSPSGSLQGAKNGLHVGTFEAARQALNARIGIPAEGYWDGTREYGKTLIAGRKRIEQTERYGMSGYNASPPDEDYYPTQVKHRAAYGSDWNSRTEVPFDVWPSILPYRIVGKMTNRPHSPHDDFKANGYMRAAQTKGVAKSGYYYQNKAEDSGSISAVVPNGGAHLEPITEAERRVDDRHIVESALNERAELIGDLQTQRDPSLQQVIGLLKRSAEQSLRGIVVGGSVYVWDAYDGYHEQVYHALTGVDVKDIFGRPKEYSNFRFVMFTKGTDDMQMGDWTATGPMYEIAPQVYMVGYAGAYTNPTVKSWLRKAKPIKDDPLNESQELTLRGWLSPANEFIAVGKYQSHSSMVKSDPARFDYSPEDGRSIIPTMLSKGWVRIDANTAHPDPNMRAFTLSLEAQTLDRAYAGAIYAAQFMEPTYIHVDVYDPRGWFSLEEPRQIAKFLRTRKIPDTFRPLDVGYNLREHAAPQRPVWYSPKTDTMDPVDAHAPAMARKYHFYTSHMGLPEDPKMNALIRRYEHPDSDEDDEIAMTNRAIALGFVRVYADRDELIVDGRDPDIVRKTVARFARDYPYKKVLAHIHSPEQELQMSADQCKIYLRTGKVPPARFAETALVESPLINEGRSEPVLFHAINTHNALAALEAGAFQLGIAPAGGADAQYQKDHPYYLSMAHSANARYGRDRRGGVTIEFNRDYLKARYKIIPIDYWGGMRTSDQERSGSGSDLEQEDRLLSKDQQLPIPTPATKMIRAIHVLVPKKGDWHTQWERRLIVVAKSKGIPVHVYDDYRRFQLAMPAAAVGVDAVMPALKARYAPDFPPSQFNPKKSLARYRELLFKKDKSELSPEAIRALRFSYRDMVSAFNADLHNARSLNRDDAQSMLRAMQQFGIKSEKEYADFIAKKWPDDFY